MTAFNSFKKRHIGISEEDKSHMLTKIGVSSLNDLIDKTIPENIRTVALNLPEPLTEFEYLRHIKQIAKKNTICKSYIGMGYYDTITPAVIRRNVFENPGWYTQYTPYQAEIAQGRLESLINFQTVVSDLTALPIANASLLDDATAAAELMQMFFNAYHKRKVKARKFFVDKCTFPQIIDVLQTRAEPLKIEIIIEDFRTIKLDDTFFGTLVQYPNSEGNVSDYRSFTQQAKDSGIYVGVIADIMSLAVLCPPGEWGADCAIGNTQRFGVPMGFGGPHAAYMATTDDFKRLIPGRIIGISKDRLNQAAYRMALQTREQHIRREKATSNICTAQALLANMAAMYAVYHGYEGIKNIATTIHQHTVDLASKLSKLGFQVKHQSFFDTLYIETANAEKIHAFALKQHVNLFLRPNGIQLSLDETCTKEDVTHLVHIFEKFKETTKNDSPNYAIPNDLCRTSTFLQYSVFENYRSETELMRYIKHLENKDLSLTHAMIPLGSCTMKLNAAVELEPVSWPEFANIHPFAPSSQTKGYQQIINELEKYLSNITGFHSTSLQPNSGAQGEFSGLLLIQAYHASRGDIERNIVLIPESAHGTNPASAVMAGCKVVVVKCDEYGNIDIKDLEAKAKEHKEHLSSLMITYPSTHGVFEHHIKEIIDITHSYGGQVYMDGANMNAQVGFTSPGAIGADVCHLNLHKTFAIPHGGGGPGVGPICCAAHLAPFLPGNAVVKTGGENAIKGVSAAPWGSASILLISYAYIKLLGAEGLKECTQYAILNANYIKAVLEKHYDVLYVGKEHGHVAHELILDFRAFKHSLKIEVEDIAKRLIDYGFHAPTVSFPVAGTLMIEPTESESLREINRFCDAMIAIRKEIDEVAKEHFDKVHNPLKNAPHTMLEVCASEWNHNYSRETAAFPTLHTRVNKFWPTVARVNNSHGDRNLICTCPSLNEYIDA